MGMSTNNGRIHVPGRHCQSPEYLEEIKAKIRKHNRQKNIHVYLTYWCRGILFTAMVALAAWLTLYFFPTKQRNELSISSLLSCDTKLEAVLSTLIFLCLSIHCVMK